MSALAEALAVTLKVMVTASIREPAGICWATGNFTSARPLVPDPLVPICRESLAPRLFSGANSNSPASASGTSVRVSACAVPEKARNEISERDARSFIGW